MKTLSTCRAALRFTAGILLGVLVVNCDIEPENTDSNGDCAGPYAPGGDIGGTHQPPAHTSYWVRFFFSEHPTAIAGDATNNMIVVGEGGLILPLDDRIPDHISNKNLYDVWVGDNVAFAVGAAAAAFRFDGETWAEIPAGGAGDLYGVWASGANDVFAVGQFGNIAHFDGSTWTVSSLGSYTFFSVWGSSPTDVFAVGSSEYARKPVIFHYDGTSWTNMGAVDAARSLVGVWGTSSENVYAIDGHTVLHYDGSRWSTSMTGPGFSILREVWGTSSSNIYVVGTSGALLHYDGLQWTEMRITDEDLVDVSGTGRSDIRIVTFANHLFHYDGSVWTQEPLFPPHRLNGVWAQSDANVYVVGDHGAIFNRQGAVVAPMHVIPSGTSEDLYAVWGNTPGSIYAAGANGTLLRYNGTDWNPIVTGTTVTLRDVWSTSDDVVYVVGDDGTILQGGNDIFTRVVSNAGADLNAVFGTVPGNAYAVGDGGALLHYDGSTWTRMNSGTTQDLFGVWTDALNDLVVAGANATFRTYKLGWKAVDVPVAGDIRALWGTDFKHLHALAASNFLSFNGNEVRKVPIYVPVTGSLTAVHGASQIRAFAVADDGVMYDYFGAQ